MVGARHWFTAQLNDNPSGENASDEIKEAIQDAVAKVKAFFKDKFSHVWEKLASLKGTWPCASPPARSLTAMQTRFVTSLSMESRP